MYQTLDSISASIMHFHRISYRTIQYRYITKYNIRVTTRNYLKIQLKIKKILNAYLLLDSKCRENTELHK